VLGFAKEPVGETGWGESGFFQIGYGQCGIDAEMYARRRCGPQPEPHWWTPRSRPVPRLANIMIRLLALAWTGTDGSHHLNVEAVPSDGLTILLGKSPSGVKRQLTEPGLVVYWKREESVSGLDKATDSAHHS